MKESCYLVKMDDECVEKIRVFVAGQGQDGGLRELQSQYLLLLVIEQAIGPLALRVKVEKIGEFDPAEGRAR